MTESTSILDDEFRLLQAIRLKGRLAVDAAAFTAGESEELLARLADRQLITVGRAGAKLTPAGRERLTELVALEREGVDHNSLSRLYEEFGGHNAELKEVVTAWQLRPDGSPNDHSNTDYDTDVVRRLAEAASDAAPLVTRIAGAVPRLDTYPVRLRAAVENVVSGDHKWLASPLIDSYHQVWFELHEELLNLLGLVRADEARQGRA